jgi:hypothetical protein
MKNANELWMLLLFIAVCLAWADREPLSGDGNLTLERVASTIAMVSGFHEVYLMS